MESSLCYPEDGSIVELFNLSFLGVDFQEVIFLGMGGLAKILVKGSKYNFLYISA